MLDLDKDNIFSGSYIMSATGYKKQKVKVYFYNGEYFVIFKDNEIQSVNSLPDDTVFRTDNFITRLLS